MALLRLTFPKVPYGDDESEIYCDLPVREIRRNLEVNHKSMSALDVGSFVFLRLKSVLNMDPLGNINFIGVLVLHALLDEHKRMFLRLGFLKVFFGSGKIIDKQTTQPKFIVKSHAIFDVTDHIGHSFFPRKVLK